jgi:hypothetical protein
MIFSQKSKFFILSLLLKLRLNEQIKNGIKPAKLFLKSRQKTRRLNSLTYFQVNVLS